MNYVIEIEHEYEGIQEFNDIKFNKALPFLIENVNRLKNMMLFPRIGEKLYVEIPIEESYKIVDIIYYNDCIKIVVNEIFN